MSKVVFVAAIAGLVLASPGAGWAQASPDDAIRNRVRQYEAAYNAGDAGGMAAIYAPDASHTYVTGQTHHGRAEIAKGLAEMIAGPMKGTRLSMAPLVIRALTSSVAVEEASFSMSGLKDASGAVVPPIKGLCLAVYQKQGAEWFAAAVQCMVPPPPPK